MLGFAPTASLAGSGDKLGMDLRIGQQRTVDCVMSPSSREQWDCSTLSMTHERLPRTRTTHRKHTPDVRGLAQEAYVAYWSGFPQQGVHRFDSPRLSDMSNRLFVAVIS
jgi:hypothetical protein